uniref:RRM domain-containing protein n=1 Tax=Tetradesmus obliquus TaxID=3088 RepID=A0A383VKQ6_TETOB
MAAKPDPGAAVFFARAPADASTEEIHDLFSQFGDVEGINIYRSWPSAKSSKGCGTVQFAACASALAARQALHGRKAFARAEAPLVVEPLDLRKPKQPPAASTVQQKAKDTVSACLPAHMSSGSSGNGPRALSNNNTSFNGNAASSNSSSSSRISETAAHPVLLLQPSRSWCGSLPAAAAAAAELSIAPCSEGDLLLSHHSQFNHLKPDITWRTPGVAWQSSWQQQQQQQQQVGGRSNSFPGIGTSSFGGAGGSFSLEAAARGDMLAVAAAAACRLAAPPKAMPAWAGNAAAAAAVNGQTALYNSMQAAGQPLLEQQLLNVTISARSKAYHSFDGSPHFSPLVHSSMTAAAAAAAAAAGPLADLRAQLGASPPVSPPAAAAAAAAMAVGALTMSESATAAAAAFGPISCPYSSDLMLADALQPGLLQPGMLQQAAAAATAADVADVSLGSWTHLLQAGTQHNAAAAAAGAAAAVEQALLLGHGIAAPSSPFGLLQAQQQQQQQQQQQLSFPGQAGASASQEFMFAATGSPLIGQAMPFPAAGGSIGCLQLLLPPPPPQQQQQQQQQQRSEWVLEVDSACWSSIAESGGWRSVTQLSGAQIQAKVQPDSPRIIMTVAGTAEQLHMARNLVQLLLQQRQWQQQQQN